MSAECRLRRAAPARGQRERGGDGVLRVPRRARVFAFYVKLNAYARVVKALKRQKLVHPNYNAEADGGPQSETRAMLPSTFLAVASSAREGDAVRRGGEDAASGALLAASRASDRLDRVPRSLRDALLPFQERGVRFELERNGRCLIADEMGVGKTIQALAIASCFLSDGPMLVICPPSMRPLAREAERWLPELSPRTSSWSTASADAFALDDVRLVAEAKKKAIEEETRAEEETRNWRRRPPRVDATPRDDDDDDDDDDFDFRGDEDDDDLRAPLACGAVGVARAAARSY